MKRNMLLLLYAAALLFSCTKVGINHPDPKTAASTVPRAVGTPQINLMLTFTGSTNYLDINASVYWMGEEPLSYDGYTMHFTVTGASNSSEGDIEPLTSYGAISGTTVTFNGSAPKTVTVKAELFNGLTSLGSATSSLTVAPGITFITSPSDSLVRVTLTRTSPYYPMYTMTAWNIGYVQRSFRNVVYMYVFYIPSADQRTYQGMKTLYLGSKSISLSGGSFDPQIEFSFTLPNENYLQSNVHCFLSSKSYNETYFQHQMVNVGYETYLIDQCINDAVLYDIYTRGLLTINPYFSDAHPIGINGLSQMLETQTSIMKARGFLW